MAVGARAQQRGKLPTIGFLGSGTPAAQSRVGGRLGAAAPRTRLDRGSQPCDRVSLGGGKSDSATEFAAEFVRLKVDLIVTYANPIVLAAKQAASGVPIVFAAAADPLGTGLVASLARPGGNATGLSIQNTDLVGKRLELLRDLIPGLRRLAIMVNVGNSASVLEMREVQAAARTIGLEVATLEIRRPEEISPALEELKGHAEALYVCIDTVLFANRIRISTMALGHRLPTMLSNREFVAAGGLMSYGPNFPDLFRRAADLVDKILRGAKPAEFRSNSRSSSISSSI